MTMKQRETAIASWLKSSALALTCVMSLSACNLLPENKTPIVTSDTQLDAVVADDLAGLQYPSDAPLAPDLDIVVVQTDRDIQLVNRTARSLRNVRIWLNQQYVTSPRDIEIGTGNRIDLRQFVNSLREPFPVGTFLATEKTSPVLLAELHDLDLDVRYRLVVQHNDDNPPRPFFR